MKTTTELAREAGNDDLFDALQIAFLARFEALVRADEREQGQRWFDAVTAQHKQMILVEREACAKLAEWEACAKVAEWEPWRTNTPKRIAAAIRARENMTKEALTLDSRKKGPL